MLNIYSQQINIWAVLLGAVLAMVVGYLWYMQIFGNLWTKENKFKPEDMKDSSPVTYLIMFSAQVVMGLSLAWFLKATVADTYVSTLRVVFGVWAAFTFLPYLSTYLSSWRSVKLTLIDSGYYLVTLFITGSILFFWK